MHGYEVIRELSERTNGMWEPSPGSIYPTLQLLEDEGLVSVEESEGRKQYSLTEQGKAEAAQRASSTAPWEEFTSGADPAGGTASEFGKLVNSQTEYWAKVVREAGIKLPQ